MTAILVMMLIAATGPGMQATSKPMQPNKNVRRVCLEEVDVYLGDSYEAVGKLLELRPDPAGGEADFVATPGGPLGDGSGALHRVVSFRFDDRRRLESATIRWTYDGERTPAAAEQAFALLVANLGSCLDLDSARLSDGRYRRRVDYGTYSEEVELDAANPENWRMHYQIRRQP